GWGCPSSEAPDWEASIKKIPLQTEEVTPTAEGEQPGPAANPIREDPFGRRPRTEGNMPELPPDQAPLFPREGEQEQPDAPTTPRQPETQPDTTLPGITPDTERPTALIPPGSNPVEDAIAPPLAPPSATVPTTIPEPPTTSGAYGVVP